MLGSVSQPGPVIADQRQRVVHQPVERVEQDLEGQSDTDGRHQHREEDDRPEVAPPDDLGGEEHAEQHAEHDLDPRGENRVDEGVGEAADQRRLAEERDEVVQPDELGAEQGPAGQAEVERGERRDREQHDEQQRRQRVEPQRVRALTTAAGSSRGLRRVDIRRGQRRYHLASPGVRACRVEGRDWGGRSAAAPAVSRPRGEDRLGSPAGKAELLGLLLDVLVVLSRPPWHRWRCPSRPRRSGSPGSGP